MNKTAVHAIIMVLTTILAKVLGFCRELSLAFSYGAGSVSDAYVVAFTLPTILFSGLGTAMLTSYISVYTDLQQNHPGEEKPFHNQVITMSFLLSVGFIAVFMALRYPIVRLFALGFEGSQLDLAVNLSSVMIASLIFLGVGYILQGYLQMKGCFFTVGMVSVPLNIAVIATILGTLAAIGIYSMKRRPQSVMMTLTNIPMTMPDIVTGISLMLLFLFTKVERGLITMIMAHITFNTPYVILSVMPKLKQMNKHSYEAALDLGATPGYALTHVIIPEIRQGIITGAMLAFTLSLDDFTISYFTTSPMVQNLSTLIYSKARIGIDPTLNALSALMFVALLVLLIIVNRRTADNSQKA